MSSKTPQIEDLANQEYKYGFYTDIEADSAPPGLSEDIIRFISAKKKEPEFMLEWRLKAYRHWLTMTEPKWPNVEYPPIDYQDIVYYSAPKRKEGNVQEAGNSARGAGTLGRGCRRCRF
jgi:Fe-S cluster assembly protein SufB